VAASQHAPAQHRQAREAAGVAKECYQVPPGASSGDAARLAAPDSTQRAAPSHPPVRTSRVRRSARPGAGSRAKRWLNGEPPGVHACPR